MPFGLTALGIGSLVGAGLGISGAATANSNYKSQVKTQKELMGLQYNYNEKAAEEAYRREKEMYQRTFEDSSYATQKKRMEEAGLNVGLMYSQGAGGAGGAGHVGGGTQGSGVSAASAPDAMRKSEMIAQAGMGIQQAAATAADVNLKEAQARNLDADTAKKAGVDTAEAESRIALNWQTMQNLIGEAEGQRLQNEFDSIRNDIKNQSKEWEINEIYYRADEMFQKAEKAYEEKLQAVEDTARMQETTKDFVEQMALMTKQMIIDVIQKEANVELTRNQIAEIWANIRLKEEGNEIEWDRNAIHESLGIVGLETQKRGQIIGAVGQLMGTAATIYGSYKLTRAMMGTTRAAQAGATSRAGMGRVVQTFNNSGDLISRTVTTPY